LKFDAEEAIAERDEERRIQGQPHKKIKKSVSAKKRRIKNNK
jgi:hypothetical protein